MQTSSVVPEKWLTKYGRDRRQMAGNYYRVNRGHARNAQPEAGQLVPADGGDALSQTFLKGRFRNDFRL